MGFEVKEPYTIYAQQGIVLDNSVAMRWLVASGKPSDQRYALHVREHIHIHRPKVCVPYLWTYEAANVVSQYVHLGELEYDLAAKTLISLQTLCSVMIERETPLALLECSNTYQVSAYDAAYLLLAQGEGMPIATLDKKMRQTAKKMGVPVLGTNKPL